MNGKLKLFNETKSVSVGAVFKVQSFGFYTSPQLFATRLLPDVIIRCSKSTRNLLLIYDKSVVVVETMQLVQHL